MKTFHKIFYAVLRFFVSIWAFFTGYTHDSYEPKSSNYLVLTNHNTDIDFFYFGLILKRQMYHVASEHIFRLGFVSKLIVFLQDPIPRTKGASGDEAVRLIRERLDAGDNVCMMAEGNRSFTGETGYIVPRTAVLAKESGAGLITLRLHGGYLSSPRWSRETRKGPLHGEFVHEYTPEDLAAMTVEEVYEAIKRDVYVNAYEDQEKAPARYRAKAPAEHLETAVFVCPCCHDLSSMSSEGDRFFCRKCGYEVKFNEYGMFEKKDGDPVFSTVLDWSRWQLEYLKGFLPGTLNDPDLVLSTDADVYLAQVKTGEGTNRLVTGTLTLTPRAMTVSDGTTEVSLPVESIERISVTGVNKVLLTADGVYYEMGSERPYSGLKYLICSRLLAGKEYY